MINNNNNSNKFLMNKYFLDSVKEDIVLLDSNTENFLDLVNHNYDLYALEIEQIEYDIYDYTKKYIN